MNLKILDVLACPICKGKLHYVKDHNELICKFNKLVFPIKDGVPILLADKAKQYVRDK